jgi:hypothetical protein
MQRLLLLLLLLAVAHPAQSQRHSRGSGRHDVHVGGYYRKNGTYVHSHDRAAPGLGTHKSPSSGNRHSSSHRASSRSIYSHRSSTNGSSTPSLRADTPRSNKRSRAARDAFEREHPCPSTGKRSGRCPGYVVDHVNALACGGVDAPSNMQWQTTAAAKMKDKTERVGCR